MIEIKSNFPFRGMKFFLGSHVVEQFVQAATQNEVLEMIMCTYFGKSGDISPAEDVQNVNAAAMYALAHN